MGNMTTTIEKRHATIVRTDNALIAYDVEGRVERAQYELEFEDGIKVANEVMAEFIADIEVRVLALHRASDATQKRMI